MKNNYLMLFVCLCLCSCKSVIDIEGNIKNFPNNKIYLLDQTKGNTPETIFDSAKVSNGKFLFRKKVNKNYYPKMVTLSKIKGSGIYSSSPFFIVSKDNLPDSNPQLRNLFYAEKGKTFISGDYNGTYLIIETGRENKFTFNDTSPSAWLHDNADSSTREARLDTIKTFIKNNNSLFYYFEKINDEKTSFTANELGEILPLFNKRILKSKQGKDLIQYYHYKKKNANLKFTNFRFMDSNDVSAEVLDTNAKVILLNFWASWCSPCREEIPSLLSLYQTYSASGLQIVSISIDKSKKQWKDALAKLQLPWKQFIIPANKEQWIRKFDAYSIPETILLSQNFKVAKKNYGYDKSSLAALDSTIERLIKE